MPGPRLVSRPWLGGSLLRFGGCRLSQNVFILDHVMSKATKTSKWLVWDFFLIISRPKPPKLPTGYHAGIVSDPRLPKNSPNAFSTISLGVVCLRNDPPFEMAFHSEWLRNNPKGPIPPRAPKAPLGPFGPLDSPWVHLGPLGPLVPFGSPWVLWVPLGCEFGMSVAINDRPIPNH